MSKWAVKSFHINVSVGDCAIHLLLERPPDHKHEYYVHAAVLVDGGTGSENANLEPFKVLGRNPTPLSHMIQRISQLEKYKWVNAEQRFVFDSIVVTHWDEDHYGGLVESFAADMGPDRMVPYLRYGTGGATDPQTYLYAPNIVGSGDKYNSMARDWKCDGYEKPVYFVKHNIPFAICRYCKKDNDPSGVIGVNFFNNALLGDPKRGNTAANLIKNNPPSADNDGRPGLYCVGVQQKTFPNPGQVMIVQETISKTNRVSIAAMIMWSQTSGTPLITHYFAGDMNEQSEKEILLWLQRSGILEIFNVKLSHHGSRSSTPLEMYKVMKPSNIIISNPKHKYFHPGWETIFATGMYTRTSQGLTQFDPTIRMWALRYPFYFVQNKLGQYPVIDKDKMLTSKGVVRTFDKPSKHASIFINWLKSQYYILSQRPGGMLETDEYDFYKNLVNTKKRPDQLNGLMRMIEQRWNAYGFPNAEMFTGPSAAYQYPWMRKIDSNSLIEYISVTSSGGFLKGAIEYGTYDGREYVPSRLRPWSATDSNAINQSLGANQFGTQSAMWATAVATESSGLGSIAMEEEEVFDELNPGDNENEMDQEDDDSEGDDDDIAIATLATTPAAPPGPVIPQPLPVIDPPDNAWYFFWSGVQDSEIKQKAPSIATSVSRVSANPPLDAFIGCLRCNVISLSARPVISTPGSTTQLLKGFDEWYSWLGDSIGAKAVSIINTADQSIGGFEFLIALNKPDQGDPTVVLFNTTPTALTNTFTPATVPSLGLTTDTTTLILAMDVQPNQPSTLAPLTLDDIFKFVALNDLLDGPATTVFQKLELNVPNTPADLEGQRNAVWFQPKDAYRTTVRIRLGLTDASTASLNNYFSVVGLNLTSVYVIARKSCTWSSTPTSVMVKPTGHLTILATASIDKVSLDAIVELAADTTRIILTLNTPTANILDDILNWILSVANGVDNDPFDFTTLQGKQAGSNTLGTFDFRRLTIDFAHDSGGKDGGNAKITAFTIEMQLSVAVKQGSNPLLFLLTYRYVPGAGQSIAKGSTLRADLWCAPPSNDKEKLFILPDYEDYALLVPIPAPSADSWPRYVDLAAIGGFDDRPHVIPTRVSQASLLVAQHGITFTGALHGVKPSHSSVPQFQVDAINLMCGYTWGTGSTEKDGGLIASLTASASLTAPTGSKYGGAMMKGSVYYENSTWKFHAQLNQLYAANLMAFFDGPIQEAVGSMLDSIEVDSLSVDYVYSGGIPSTLDIVGTLNIGDLKFYLKYHHDTAWTFDANLRPQENPPGTVTMLGSVLGSLFGTDAITDMPSFITNLQIKTNPTDDVIGMHMAQITDDDTKAVKAVFFTAYIEIEGFRFQYIQIRGIAADDGSGDPPPPLKRIFIASIDSIPSVTVPLIGDITQPFDEAFFMWVQPQTNSTGLTRGEVAEINAQIAQLNKTQMLSQKPLIFQDLKKGKNPQDADVVIQNGMHLALVLKDDKGTPNIVLDYVFGKTEVKPTNSSPRDVSALVHTEGADPPAPAPSPSGSGGPQMAAYEKSFGPLAVKNIGFKCGSNDDKTADIISIKVDAMVTLGPVAFELIGFRLDLSFPKGSGSGTPLSLHHLPKPDFHLDGMAAAFDRPPLEMAGVFVHGYDEATKTDYYEGGVSLAYTPWAFAACGYYGQTYGDHPFKTAFVYAILNGPLVTLEFAEITGIVAGFGYNSNLKFPDINNVLSFPLLQTPAPLPAPGGTGPVGALDALIGTGWFLRQDGSFWVAAGLTVTAFEMLTVQAVVCVEWDPSVKLGIFGIVTGDYPPALGEPNSFKFFHIQFGIIATLDVDAGTLKIDGQLMPTSFIYSPSCHLTGGFAMYSWFDSKDPTLKGDWVFSIGGYHPSYIVPSHYPTPQRLGISWQFNDNISISGQAYFAITPKVCMGGARLDLSLSLGPLSAWFDAYVDFLINYKPFHFIADGGISVGVRFTLDLWLVTIHISVEIGATLFIAGPPLYGTVHVDFWVFGFDIHFGDSSNDTLDLCLQQFIDLVCQADPSAGGKEMLRAFGGPSGGSAPSSALSPSEPANSWHVYSVTSGLVPLNKTETTPNSEMWYVRAATFSFMVSCKFAIDEAKIETYLPDGTTLENTDTVAGTGNDIHAKPMGSSAGKVTSVLTVQLTPKGTHQLLLMSVEDAPPEPVWNINSGINKSLPLALWGPYDPKADPSKNTNPQSLLNGTTGKTVDLMTGVNLTRPKPVHPDDDKHFPAFDYEVAQVDDDLPHEPFPEFDLEPEIFTPSQPDETPGGKQWDLVRDAWQKPKGGPGAADQAVQSWVDVGLTLFGWDPTKMDAAKNEQLTGALPTELVDGLETYYMWAPMIAVATAA